MKKLLFILALVFIISPIYSQQLQNSIFTNGDKLYITLGDNSEFYYSHTVEKGHTIYSLSKAYNVSTSKIYDYNRIKEGSTISLSQILRIPLSDRQLYKGVNLDNISTGHYIPVYYKTQPKDNIFRIARVYFNQPMDDLVRRNKLSDNNLALGQDLLVGWLLVDGKLPRITKEESELGEENFEELNDLNNNVAVKIIDDVLALSDQEESVVSADNVDSLASAELTIPSDFNPTLLGRHTYSKGMRTVKKTDVAFWDKSLPDNGAVFGLHGSAMIGSYISIFNPNSKRSVRVRVIGRIPYGTYTNDVKLVISPRAASQLGGLDRRFKVEISYLVIK